MSAHTPGPWFTWRTGRTARFGKVAVAYRPDTDAEPVEICELPGHWPEESRGEIAANARLIAAAPELLAAAEAVLKDARGWCGVVGRSRGVHSEAAVAADNRYRALRAAIAKAKG